jgi:PEP-CTERM motif-containing protein
MRRVVVVAILAMALPIAAWASGLDLVNRAGTVKFDTVTNVLSCTGSHLHQFNNIVAPPGGGLGFVSFATGALDSGDILTGGTFSSVNSFFNVVGTGGHPGVPKGPIFTGAFVGEIAWNLMNQIPPGDLEFQLVGRVKGQLFDGRTVAGTTTQNITIFKGEFFREHDGHIHTGNTTLTPEPGTLALLGTGLVGIATVVRRKLAS